MREEARFVGSVLFWTLVVVAFLGLISLGWWWMRVQLADEIGKGNAEIMIQSAPNRLYQYDHFFQLCVAVQNAETAIDASTAQLDQTTDEFYRYQIQANLTGQQINRAGAINQYNADSRKYYTSEQFKAWNLPDQIPSGEYVAGSEHTQCAISE